MNWTRRRFLQAMGASAAAPLLLPLMRQVFAADTSMIPRRFVIVVEGNGVEPVNLLSQAARAALDPGGSAINKRRVFTGVYGGGTPREISGALSTAPALGALAQDGIEAQSSVVLGLSNTIAGGGHSSIYGGLGCMRSMGITPAGETIDAALAKLPWVRGEAQGRGVAPFEAFRACIHSNINAQTVNGLCAFGEGAPAPLFVSQDAAYGYLFGSAATGEAGRMFATRNKMLDFTRRDIERALSTFSGSSLERAKLEAYLASVVDLEARQRLLSNAEWTTTINAVKPPGPGEMPEAGQPAFDTASQLDRLALHFDMATAALQGGLSNVCVLGSGIGGGYDMTYEGIDPNADANNRHSVCHLGYDNSLGGATTDNLYGAYLRKVTTRHVDMIARMARKLAQTPEMDGSTLLDHTLILYMSDNGEVHHASGEEWPMLLIGGKKMGFMNRGSTWVYPSHGKSGYRQVSNMFNTLGLAAGGGAVPDEVFPDKLSTKFEAFGQESETQRQARGPLAELWSPVT